MNAAAETDISKPPLPVSGRLSLHLEAVSFCYLPEQPVILDLTLEISPDRPTVITGPSGCGKSTLAKLISGIYRPDCGVVEANGHKLTDYDERSVRQAIAYLPQEPELFSGSVQDNILLGNAAATDQEIRSALVESGCDLLLGSCQMAYSRTLANVALTFLVVSASALHLHGPLCRHPVH